MNMHYCRWHAKQTDKTGVSLLELLIGFFILASTSVIFFQAMHKFKKETTFYSEHFVASALSEKVLEQCYQETEINPYGITALGLSDADGNTISLNTEVTDNQTIFFQQPTINQEEMAPLHHLLNDNFTLHVEPELNGNFYEIKTSFNWKAMYGVGKSETYCRILAFPSEKEVLTYLALSDSAVEERLVSRVFSAPDTALSANLGSIGAQKLVMNLGHIYYACFDLFSSADFKKRCADAETLEIGSSPGSDQYAECSAMYYEVARDLLHLMVYLKPRLEEIKAGSDFMEAVPFRERLILEGYRRRAGLYYKQLRRMFLASVLKLAERFEQSLNHAGTLREQRELVGQIFNFYRILYVNRDFCSDVATVSLADQRIRAKYADFLQKMIAFFNEKDSAIKRMAILERSFIASNEIKTRYFVPKLLHELFTEVEEFADSKL
jgi:hypothetical protein